MPHVTSLLSGAIEKLIFHPMTVTESEMVGEHSRLVRLQGDVFKGLRWIPGQAVEFYLGKLTKRAYTPMDVDPDQGAARFLFFLHGGGPGSAWAGTLETGDVCHVLRPKNSLDFTSFTRPALFFGDETSLAAARAMSCHRGFAAGDRIMLEVTSPVETKAVVAKLGLEGVELLAKTSSGSHLDGAVERLAESAAAMGSPQWVFTGQARSIQTIRTRLRDLGVASVGSKVRAYWSPGKTGMD
jgi:NADPH-dependent ferric siderophore reductase